MATASISSKIGRQYTRVGTWNVRTLKNKEQEVIEEMKKYRLSVLWVSETHLKGCGEKETGGAVMVYSGVTEGRAKGGVALIIAGEMRDCLKEWQCVSERLVKVRILSERSGLLSYKCMRQLKTARKRRSTDSMQVWRVCWRK